MIPISSHIRLIIIDQDDKFGNDEYYQSCDTEDVDDGADVDEDPGEESSALPTVCHCECEYECKWRGCVRVDGVVDTLSSCFVKIVVE